MHPDQHALAYMIPTSGSDSGNALMYFANDGGIYRALDGFGGLNTGSCSGTNQFDDLNQNLGSMTQFVSFSQHPTDPDTLLGGTQDNGSPATNQATTNSSWGNVLGGDGGYNAIDPTRPSNFYASNPDVPPGGLGIQLCSSGVNCLDSSFNFVVTQQHGRRRRRSLLLPLHSRSAILNGYAGRHLPRLARPAHGRLLHRPQPELRHLGLGHVFRKRSESGPRHRRRRPHRQQRIPRHLRHHEWIRPPRWASYTPPGGHVWFTGDATSGPSTFSDVTNNGPQGSINPNQFPISSVAIDSSDTTGYTAYVTVMGFTGGTGHVWKTTNAGTSWMDFTANLPDAPVNAVVVDPASAKVYVATDVGVFLSSTSAAAWTELGPVPGGNQTGFLPNVAVTALALFNSGGQNLLRASTYGRGIWQLLSLMQHGWGGWWKNNTNSITYCS